MSVPDTGTRRRPHRPPSIPLRAVLRSTALIALVVAGGACAAVPSPAPAPAPAPAPEGAAGEAQVTVVHGLRGELVDVYVDGKLLLDGFQPDRLTSPLPLPAGPHTVDLRPAGTPATDPPKATATADVPAGPVSVVAHFAPDGGWTMSLFTNQVEPLAAGVGKVVFRNAAAVTPVAVMLSGGVPVPAIDVGKEADETLPAASYAVKVGAADGATLLPDNDIDVGAGKALILYLVGKGDSLTWLSQEVAAGAAAPAAVQAGNSGLLGSGPDAVGRRYVGVAAAIAGFALAGRGLLRSRRPAMR